MRPSSLLIWLLLAPAWAQGESVQVQGQAAETHQAPRLWLYCPTNCLVDANIDALGTLFQRAHAAGYAAVLLDDSKFSRLADMDAHYFANIARLKALAKAASLEIVPAICPIGYSNDLLSRDPNLAEALPVRDSLYVVHQGVAELQADPSLSLPPTTELSRWSWHDPVFAMDDGGERVTNPTGNARMVETVALKPFQQYHLSVWIRTSSFSGSPEVHVLSGADDLSFSALGTAPTQPWTQAHVVFNSLDHTTASIYLGQWGAAQGQLWWKDARLTGCGLVNLVRRSGAPLTIQRDDGSLVEEGAGADMVARISDPKMGNWHWPGDYDVYHQPPLVHTTLRDGTRLHLSYYHAITVGNGQVMICPSEPKSLAVIQDQIRRIHAAWGAAAYFLSHDEIRVLNWDASCQARHLTPGQILSANLASCLQDVRAIAPAARLYVWSDMFDPNHNAHDHYYLVHGDLTGSWQDLDPGVTVALWNFGTRDTSPGFFARRGNRLLIAGFYDAPVPQIRDWLAGTRGLPVDDLMYTTWRGDYSQLEAFAHAARSP